MAGTVRKRRVKREHGNREFFHTDDVLAGRSEARDIAAGRPFALTDALDRRTVGYRQFAELAGSIAADLGGMDRLTTLQRRMVQHAASLDLLLESEERRLLDGEPLRHPDIFMQAVNCYRRLGVTLGMKRTPRRIPSLGEYIAGKQAASNGDDED